MFSQWEIAFRSLVDSDEKLEGERYELALHCVTKRVKVGQDQCYVTFSIGKKHKIFRKFLRFFAGHQAGDRGWSPVCAIPKFYSAIYFHQLPAILGILREGVRQALRKN